MPCEKLLEYLTANNVAFELKNHPNAFAAQDVAFKAGVPGRLFAKTVMVKLNGKMAMAVLPADSKVDFHLLRETAGASTGDGFLRDKGHGRTPGENTASDKGEHRSFWQ